MLPHLERQATLDLIRRDDVEAFQRERAAAQTVRGTRMSAATVNREIREISTVFSWALRKGIVRANPCLGLRSLKGIKRIRQPLSPEEIAKLLPELPERLRDMARLILNTGLRVGEALHLHADDIDLTRKSLIVRSRPEYLIKDREEREIPLNEVALAVVSRRKLAAGMGLLFATASGGFVGSRNARRDLAAACVRAGIRNVDWYLMRHTFASVAARHVTPHVLKALMGHSDVRTADRYYVHVRGIDCPPPPIAASC